MRARPFQLPLTSLLRKRIEPGDFVDSYAVPLAEPELTPVQLAERLTMMPGWVNGLLWLRNGLVSPFGLKTDAHLPPANPDPGIGDYVSFFRLEELSPNEAILGEDDRHLDFRVSVLKTAGPPAACRPFHVGPSAQSRRPALPARRAPVPQADHPPHAGQRRRLVGTECKTPAGK